MEVTKAVARRLLEELLKPKPAGVVIPIADEVGDEGDQMHLIIEQAEVTYRLNQHMILLVLADAHLEWLKAEHFGTCIRCKGSIKQKRLNAAWHSPFCVTCQEQFEAWLRGIGRVPEPAWLRGQILLWGEEEAA